MNTFTIIGLCNIVIGCASIKRSGSKRNIIAYLNLILGLLLIIYGTLFAD